MHYLKKQLHYIVVLVFKLFRKPLTEETFNIIFEFFKFGIVGVSNTLISYGVYVIVWLSLQNVSYLKSYDYLIAQFFSFVLGVLWSFYWNNKFVFQKDKEAKEMFYSLLKTFASYSFTGIFLNSILLFIWIKLLNISGLIAPLLNLIVSVPLNFILNKFWAFK